MKYEYWFTLCCFIFFMQSCTSDRVKDIGEGYFYRDEGEKYVSKKVYYGDWVAISFSSYMQTLVAQYNVGEECMVYYNPQNPKKSVLKTGIALPVYSLLLGALVFIGVSICLNYI
mgnify:CR=1 FL=1